jgi:hypothetical protein
MSPPKDFQSCYSKAILNLLEDLDFPFPREAVKKMDESENDR